MIDRNKVQKHFYLKFAKSYNRQKGKLFSVSKSEKRFGVGFYPFQDGWFRHSPVYSIAV